MIDEPSRVSRQSDDVAQACAYRYPPALDEELSKYELTGAQFEILRHLWQQDGLEQRLLQERLGITSATLTGIVDGLVERKQLERRQCPTDARVKQLFLTEQGRALRDEMAAAAARVQERLLSGFSPTEAALLKDWLRRMAANMCSSGAEGPWC